MGTGGYAAVHRARSYPWVWQRSGGGRHGMPACYDSQGEQITQQSAVDSAAMTHALVAAARSSSAATEVSPLRRSGSGRFHQELYARRLRYDLRPIEAAMLAIDAARRTTVELLDMLGEAQWQRPGAHTERGVYTPERWLELNAGHAHDHAEQIRRTRTAWAARESRPSRGHAGSASDQGNIL